MIGSKSNMIFQRAAKKKQQAFDNNDDIEIELKHCQQHQ